MPELEARLTALGREVEWPATPELAERVSARLATAERRPRPRRRPLLARPLAIALILLLILAAGAVAAVPAARNAVLELFGLQGATVERRTALPTPPPERPLRLGRRTTLEAARSSLSFRPLVPASLGAPTGVYVRRVVPGGELSLTYLPRPGLPRARITRLGLVISQFRGDLAREYLGKMVDPSMAVDRVQVDGRRALWIEGAPHFFFYRGPDGQPIEDELWLAQNVLLLERGRLLVRLEGAFERNRAVAIARSLR